MTGFQLRTSGDGTNWASYNHCPFFIRFLRYSFLNAGKESSFKYHHSGIVLQHALVSFKHTVALFILGIRADGRTDCVQFCSNLKPTFVGWSTRKGPNRARCPHWEGKTRQDHFEYEGKCWGLVQRCSLEYYHRASNIKTFNFRSSLFSRLNSLRIISVQI